MQTAVRFHRIHWQNISCKSSMRYFMLSVGGHFWVVYAVLSVKALYRVSYFPALFTGDTFVMLLSGVTFITYFPTLSSACALYLQCLFPLFPSVSYFPALSIASHYNHLLKLSLLSLAAVFLQAWSFSLQVLDSKDSQRLLDGMFNKTALSCSLLRLLRSRQVHWVYLSVAVILVATI